MKPITLDDHGVFPSIFVVTVTYGDRYDYLQKMIRACLELGVLRVVVVDNSSSVSSKKKMVALAKELPNQIEVIHLPKNIGSSGGYKTGLTYCEQSAECEFIWMLDDDNRPQTEALNFLCTYWNLTVKQSSKDTSKSLALLSYRPDRPVYRRAIETGKPDLMHGMPNNFAGFHILRLPAILLSRLGFENSEKRLPSRSGNVSVAPYGGLFFHRAMLDVIGYPDETYFVYGDDYDYSHRITKNNGQIILLLDSVLEDMEASSHVQVSLLSTKISAADNPNQCYYLTRNTLRFHSRFITNRFIYYTNMIVYVSLNMIMVPLSFRWGALANFVGFIKGTWHGLTKY